MEQEDSGETKWNLDVGEGSYPFMHGMESGAKDPRHSSFISQMFIIKRFLFE